MGFGLRHIRCEGCALHPDDWDSDYLSDEQYLICLKAYRDKVAGKDVYKESCIRKEALEKLKDN